MAKFYDHPETGKLHFQAGAGGHGGEQTSVHDGLANQTDIKNYPREYSAYLSAGGVSLEAREKAAAAPAGDDSVVEPAGSDPAPSPKPLTPADEPAPHGEDASRANEFRSAIDGVETRVEGGDTAAALEQHAASVRDAVAGVQAETPLHEQVFGTEGVAEGEHGETNG